MATTYSPNLALTLQGTNDNPGTWGNITNTNLGTLLEQAISGYEVQSLTSGVTLTLTIPNGASGVARNMYLEFTGNGSTVIVPSNKKLYFVYNNCSSGTISFKVAGQTGVTIDKGIKKVLVSDGTDIEEAITLSTLEGITTANLTALGVDAGDSITSGSGNTVVGHQAGTDLTSGSLNALLGEYAGWKISSGGLNTAVGRFAAGYRTTGQTGTFVGHGAGIYNNGDANTGIGYQALAGVIAGSTGYSNTAIGYSALDGVTTGYKNAALGNGSGFYLTTGYENTFVGMAAGQSVTTNYRNTAVGYEAYYASGNYLNSSCFGYNSQVTGSNQVQLGDSATTTYVYGSVQNRSDERDKTDIRDTQLGLDFIMALRPRDFKWDMREDYRVPAPVHPDREDYATDAEYAAAVALWEPQYAAWEEANKLANITHDGTHTRNRYHQGLIAQEVKQTMDAMGVDFGGYQDHTIKGGDAVLTIGYEELIAPLIKAIQELKAEFDEYKRTHP